MFYEEFAHFGQILYCIYLSVLSTRTNIILYSIILFITLYQHAAISGKTYRFFILIFKRTAVGEIKIRQKLMISLVSIPN